MRNLFTIIFFGALLFSGSAFTIPAQSKTPTPSAEDLQKQKKAEQVVIRAMRRFGQTLDFNVVYGEMYVKDETVRREEQESLLEGFFDKTVMKNFDSSIRKRAYITSQNLFWLFLTYSFHTNSENAFDKLIGLVEREINSKLNKRQRDIYEKLFKEGKDSTIETQSEALDRLAVFEALLNVVRKHFNLKFRRDLQNKISAIANPTQSDFAQYKYAFDVVAKINKNEFPVEFLVVEEAGEMKILAARFQSGS